MNLTVSIDGRPFPLALEPNGAEWVANGRPVSVVEVEPGIYSVLLEGRSFEARLEGGPSGCSVTIGSRRLAVEVSDPRARSGRRGGHDREGRETLIAPMPGKVVRVLAASGDLVRAGQGILVIEAMKMQNEIRTAKAGRLVSLGAQPGDTVTAGQILAAIE